MKSLLLILLLTHLRLLSEDVIVVEVEEKMIGEKPGKHNELWSFHFSETNCALSQVYTDRSGLTKNLFSSLRYFEYTFDVKTSLVRLKNDNYSIEFVTEPVRLPPSGNVAYSLNLVTIKELNGIFSNTSVVSGKLITRTYRLKSPSFELKL